MLLPQVGPLLGRIALPRYALPVYFKTKAPVELSGIYFIYLKKYIKKKEIYFLWC